MQGQRKYDKTCAINDRHVKGVVEVKFYQRQNQKLLEINRYHRIKKELNDGPKENNNKERCEEKTSAA